jgi:molybdopterin converting factor small subunit
MRKLSVLIFVSFILFQLVSVAFASTIQYAYNNHKSDVQVQDVGTVIRILSDDNKGSRHQKFLLKLSSGQTILIAHNIDLAPRINSISNGDQVQFHGEYEWNKKGGVVHWTHKDPNGYHVGGWLKHKGKTYQ